MTRLADVRGVLVRLADLSDRADALRPELPPEAVEGLDIVRENARLMREELDAVLQDKPEIIPDPNWGFTPREQALVDRNFQLLSSLNGILEKWLEEWGA